MVNTYPNNLPTLKSIKINPGENKLSRELKLINSKTTPQEIKCAWCSRIIISWCLEDSITYEGTGFYVHIPCFKDNWVKLFGVIDIDIKTRSHLQSNLLRAYTILKKSNEEIFALEML